MWWWDVFSLHVVSTQKPVRSRPHMWCWIANKSFVSQSRSFCMWFWNHLCDVSFKLNDIGITWTDLGITQVISISHEWCWDQSLESMITKFIVLSYPLNWHLFLCFLECLFEITTTKTSDAAFPLATHCHVYNINSTCLLLCITMKKLWQLLICHDVYNMKNTSLSSQP